MCGCVILSRTSLIASTWPVLSGIIQKRPRRPHVFQTLGGNAIPHKGEVGLENSAETKSKSPKKKKKCQKGTYFDTEVLKMNPHTGNIYKLEIVYLKKWEHR